MRSLTAEQYLWKFNALVDTDGDCHIWLGAVDPSNGYGIFWAFNKKHAAHRWLYIARKGLVDTSNQVLHTCDERVCVNLDHLYEGSIAQNMHDKVARNRQARGSASGMAFLDEARVLEIKRLLQNGESQGSIALAFGIHVSSVSLIKIGKSWKHV